MASRLGRLCPVVLVGCFCGFSKHSWSFVEYGLHGCGGQLMDRAFVVTRSEYYATCRSSLDC